MTVFIRSDESLDHFRFDIIAVELIAISLDESLAEAHASLAFAVLQYDFD